MCIHPGLPRFGYINSSYYRVPNSCHASQNLIERQLLTSATTTTRMHDLMTSQPAQVQNLTHLHSVGKSSSRSTTGSSRDTSTTAEYMTLYCCDLMSETCPKGTVNGSYMRSPVAMTTALNTHSGWCRQQLYTVDSATTNTRERVGNLNHWTNSHQ